MCCSLLLKFSGEMTLMFTLLHLQKAFELCFAVLTIKKLTAIKINFKENKKGKNNCRNVGNRGINGSRVCSDVKFSPYDSSPAEQ